MSRKRWIQDPDTHELVPAEDYVPKADLRHHGRVIGDLHYDGLRATDGTPIDTRTKHREYMKRNGLTTVDDFKVTWQQEAKAREARMNGVDHSRKEDVARAVFNPQRGLSRRRDHRLDD
jgi:hypothetical protein